MNVGATLYIEEGEFPNSTRHFSVMRCNHCEDAPCVDICPTTALYKRDDGIVDFDNERCIGCKGCIQACPYDACYIDPNTNTAAKCNYCTHRVDIGLEPACVNVCPTHAIISGDRSDPTSEIAQLLASEEVSVRGAERRDELPRPAGSRGVATGGRRRVVDRGRLPPQRVRRVR